MNAHRGPPRGSRVQQRLAVPAALVLLLFKSTDIRSYLTAHPNQGVWDFLRLGNTRRRALRQLRRRLPYSAKGLKPIPSNLTAAGRRLSHPLPPQPQQPPKQQLQQQQDRGSGTIGPTRGVRSKGGEEAKSALGQQQQQEQQDVGPSGPQVFVGIFTAPSRPGALPYSKQDYATRREVLRKTWISTAAHYGQLVVRFVAGFQPRSGGEHSTVGGGGGRGAEGGGEGGGLSVPAELAAEDKQYDDFLWLEVEDSYSLLARKTRLFFVTVLRLFPRVEFIVKADDDVYVMPQRLLMAADQWAAARADLVSCMTHGPVRNNASHRWFDPAAPLLGRRYPLRPMGSMYGISARGARLLDRRGADGVSILRESGSPEDVSVALWLLGTDAVFWEDARLCRRDCGDAAVVALYDTRSMGLSLEAIVAAHMHPDCQAAAPWPLPYASSQGVGLEPWLEERREAAMRGRRP
ncbi:hypothetical protein PLESTM_002055600 [Pleodorina starrii]|nr:hypothetical protein PLESTM_002055600 [Pleodorina starrii]